MYKFLNPNYLLSRLLEKTGIAKTYLECVEFGAHFAWGGMFALAGVLLVHGDLPMWCVYLGHGLVIFWTLLTLVDEFVVDGFKGRDTLIDLASKLAGPMIYFGWLIGSLLGLY